MCLTNHERREAGEAPVGSYRRYTKLESAAEVPHFHLEFPNCVFIENPIQIPPPHIKDLQNRCESELSFIVVARLTSQLFDPTVVFNVFRLCEK